MNPSAVDRMRQRVRELPATARSLVLAVVVEVGVRTVPLDRLAPALGVRMAAPGHGPRLRDEAPPAAPEEGRPLTSAERQACRAVARVMRRWPRRTGTCLRESLLYGHALRSRRPVLHLGAVAGGGTPVAHAWLSFDGGTFGLRPDVLELTVDGASA